MSAEKDLEKEFIGEDVNDSTQDIQNLYELVGSLDNKIKTLIKITGVNNTQLSELKTRIEHLEDNFKLLLEEKE